MATIAKLDVILGLDDQFSDKLAGANSRAQAWGQSLIGVGKLATVGLTVPLIGAGVAAIKWASELEESGNKVDVVFGDNAQSVRSWAESTEGSLLMSTSEAMEAAGTFGNLFTSMGFTTSEAADMSTGFVELGQDLSSFNNIPVPEALDAIRAGIVGEFEPLRRLGVNISQATVEQKALELGIWDGVSAMTSQQKAMAVSALIYEQTTNAQGDAARTSKSFANQMRILKANIKDVGAAIGMRLLPYVNRLLEFLIGLVDTISGLNPAIQKFGLLFAGILAVLGPVLIVLGFLLSTFGLLGIAIAALVAIGIAKWGSDIADAFSSVVDWVMKFAESVQTLMDMGLNPLEAILMAVSEALASIGGDDTPAWIAALARAFMAFADGNYSRAFDALADAARAAFDEIRRLAGVALDWVLDTGIPTVIGWVVDVAGDVWSGIKALAGWTWDNRANIAGWIIDVATPTVSGWITGIAGRVGDWLIGLMGGGLGKGDSRTSGMSGRSSFTATLGSWTLEVALPKVNGLLEAAADFGRQVGEAIRAVDWVSVIKTAIGSSNKVGNTVGQWLREGISSISPGDVVEAGKMVAIAGAIVAALAAAFILLPFVLTAALVAFVGSALIGVAEGITGLDFSQIAMNIWNGIKNAIDTAGDWLTMLVAKGVDLLAGLVTGINTGWLAVQAWLLLLPSLILAAIGDVSRTLRQKGLDLLSGLYDGILDKWATVKAWLVSLGVWVYIAIGDVSRIIRQKGLDLLAGLYDGILDKWASVKSWLSGIGGYASGAVGSLGRALYSAGTSLMQGLKDGIAAGWEDVKSFLGSLNPANYKGPKARDLKMLRPTGMWLMEGLSVGLDRGWHDVTRQLSGYDVSLAGAVHAATSADGSGRGQTVINHNYFVTPEALQQIMRDSKEGAAFARNFGRELGMYAGQP